MNLSNFLDDNIGAISALIVTCLVMLAILFGIAHFAGIEIGASKGYQASCEDTTAKG